LQNLDPLPGVWDETMCLQSKLCYDPRKLDNGRDMFEVYFTKEKEYCRFEYVFFLRVLCYFVRSINASCDLKITYSPFHGVGQKFTPRFLKEIGFKPENIFETPDQV
jgi:phosphomannomutase